MNDREFLIWLHERLEKVHGEHELCDYMHKLRAIISSTPKGKVSATACSNSLDDLLEDLE